MKNKHGVEIERISLIIPKKDKEVLLGIAKETNLSVSVLIRKAIQRTVKDYPQA